MGDPAGGVSAGDGGPRSGQGSVLLGHRMRGRRADAAGLRSQIYGGRLWVIVVELALLGGYLLLALLSAREHTP
jgi:hypothetical protein